MTEAVLEFRVHERWGEALLVESSTFQPSEKDEQVYAAIVGLTQQSVDGLESLWQKWERQFERSGLSVAEAGAIARSLQNAVYILGRSLDLIGTCRGQQSPAAEEHVRSRLAKLGERAAPLLQILSRPAATFNPERVQRGLEEIERGGGIDAEEWLSQLTRKTP